MFSSKVCCAVLETGLVADGMVVVADGKALVAAERCPTGSAASDDAAVVLTPGLQSDAAEYSRCCTDLTADEAEASEASKDIVGGDVTAKSRNLLSVAAREYGDVVGSESTSCAGLKLWPRHVGDVDRLRADT